MDDAIKYLARMIEMTGVAGGIVVAVILGGGILAYLLHRLGGASTEARTGQQQASFQQTLLAAVERLSVIEKALREELEAAQAEKARLREELTEAVVAIELMRNQQRRMIDLLKDLIAGRRDLSSIHTAALAGGPS